ncbi:helix-turn-helix domain-containing protein [Nocardia suismassiliense]|uniref:helix-turn-helix domain-containing protein n=1 Tax=Nocardia suismassiliense TaxID=2077092 RepID=UPI000D1ECEB2|nr:helix-turn-helix transcriptional regulator [Nocardia suismassiliense]
MLLLGQTMRQCRERSNISRDKLAPRAYVTSSTLEKWETGERMPTLDKLKFWFASLNANDWYRERIISLSQPALFELQMHLGAGARLPEPSVSELRHLELLPFPACYRRLPTYDLMAANAAFRRQFPGLAPASPAAARPTNIIEWMMLSRLSRQITQEWARHAHVMVNALQVLSPGVVPQDYLDAVVASCSRAGEFQKMWDTDVSSDDIHDTDLTMLHPSRTRWVSYIASSYRSAPRSNWDLLMLTPR